MTDAREPVRAEPDGWAIDGLAWSRLARTLSRAPSSVAGVVAPSGPLAPGASYRVHAERLALRARASTTTSDITTVWGAALLRPGVDFDVVDGRLVVERGPIVIDRGAHAHDPWQPIGEVLPASAEGRPPFPRRPVVVFLALAIEPSLADWARSTVNNLVRHDVEARLAMVEVAEGGHLTRPCLPVRESVEALAPDVIVALDAGALERAPEWCRDNRATTLIEFSEGAGSVAELVSWQLGRAQGRLRARIGRRVPTDDMVALVNRLCAGPHPAPPAEPPRVHATTAPSLAVRARRLRPDRRSVAVIIGGSGDADRVAGLVDHCRAAGHRVHEVGRGESIPRSARGADVVLIQPARPLSEVSSLVTARRRLRHATIAELGPADRVAGPALSSDAAELARRCGYATTPTDDMRTPLREIGVRSQVLPALIARARAADLRAVRARRDPAVSPVIGWRTGPEGADPGGEVDAVAHALLSLLAAVPDLRVDLAGDAGSVPRELAGHERVRVRPGDPDDEALARWSLQVWTPSSWQVQSSGDDRPIAEPAFAGVPTVVAAAHPAAHLLAPDLSVERADDAPAWEQALRPLVIDRSEREHASTRAFRRADALYGDVASAAVVNRLIGWARFGDTAAAAALHRVRDWAATASRR